MERIVLTEDNQLKVQEDSLLNESKLVLNDIKRFTGVLKETYNDNKKFDELLKVLHGRFSKLELNLIKLKRLTNGTIQ